MAEPGLFAHDAIIAALEALADALSGTAAAIGTVELIVVGGSYMALRDLRAGTDDVDTVTHLDRTVRAAIGDVARQQDLAPDWLNGGTRGPSSRRVRHRDRSRRRSGWIGPTWSASRPTG